LKVDLTTDIALGTVKNYSALYFAANIYYSEKYFRWGYAQRQDEPLWRNLKKIRTEVLWNEMLCWWVGAAWYFENTTTIRNIRNCIRSDIASQPSRLEPSATPLWEFKTQQMKLYYVSIN